MLWRSPPITPLNRIVFRDVHVVTLEGCLHLRLSAVLEVLRKVAAHDLITFVGLAQGVRVWMAASSTSQGIYPEAKVPTARFAALKKIHNTRSRGIDSRALGQPGGRRPNARSSNYRIRPNMAPQQAEVRSEALAPSTQASDTYPLWSGRCGFR